MLLVPPPPIAAASVALDKLLEFKVLGLKAADGSVLAVADASSVGLFVFRGPPSSPEFWDDAQKKWRPPPQDAQLMQLKPLVANGKTGTPPSWTATLVATGQKDGQGNDVYAGAQGGQPAYFLRAFAQMRKDGVEDSGLSVPSSSFVFTDSAANARFSMQFDTPKTLPDSAHRVRMQLKGDALQPAGYVEIRAQPAFEVEIANCDASGNTLGRILLRGDGAIVLTPAGGNLVTIDGDAEFGRVLYAPAGGGAKQWLA
ncbi:MAG TPA: hypothetical protein VII56_19190 [Rhizomicrobium sp.]